MYDEIVRAIIEYLDKNNGELKDKKALMMLVENVIEQEVEKLFNKTQDK